MLSRANEDAKDVTASSGDLLVSEVTPSPEMMYLHIPNTVPETTTSHVGPPAEKPVHVTRSVRWGKLPSRYCE